MAAKHMDDSNIYQVSLKTPQTKSVTAPQFNKNALAKNSLSNMKQDSSKLTGSLAVSPNNLKMNPSLLHKKLPKLKPAYSVAKKRTTTKQPTTETTTELTTTKTTTEKFTTEPTTTETTTEKTTTEITTREITTEETTTEKTTPEATTEETTTEQTTRKTTEKTTVKTTTDQTTMKRATEDTSTNKQNDMKPKTKITNSSISLSESVSVPMKKPNHSTSESTNTGLQSKNASLKNTNSTVTKSWEKYLKKTTTAPGNMSPITTTTNSKLTLNNSDDIRSTNLSTSKSHQSITYQATSTQSSSDTSTEPCTNQTSVNISVDININISTPKNFSRNQIPNNTNQEDILPTLPSVKQLKQEENIKKKRQVAGILFVVLISISAAFAVLFVLYPTRGRRRWVRRQDRMELIPPRGCLRPRYKYYDVSLYTGY